jgi:hypothetical protein
LLLWVPTPMASANVVMSFPQLLSVVVCLSD